MPDDRRSFIKRFGVTLGSLIVSGALPGCGPRKDGNLCNPQSEVREQGESSPVPDAEGQVNNQNEPTSILVAPEWKQLRQCWLSLNKENTRNTLQDSLHEALMQGKAFTAALGKRHQEILDTLVAKGQIRKPVAGHMQVAFDEATFHIALSSVTCYYMIPIEYWPREDLLKRTAVLGKISGDLDPATVAKAQCAIAQDVAFFEIFKAGKGGYDRALEDNYSAGRLEVSPEALEAARLLAQLFLERPE